MGILNLDFIKGFTGLCQDGWDQGWHERNGGNLTYRLTDDQESQIKPFIQTQAPWVPLGLTVSNLKNAFFLATGSGKYFRNVCAAPKDNICLTQINPAGDHYRMVWGLAGGGRPTSEFPSHIMNHSVRIDATQNACRVIYHAHPTNIIAMTFILPLTDKTFTRALWQSATECPVVFPGGVGVVPWMVPGGPEIAKATGEMMKKYDAAVWAHHGLFVSGPDFDTAFGLMHTIEKAAEIYMCVQQSGKPVLQTISDQNLLAIADAFGVKLNQAFLENN